jgi:signal transduction histidine kinase
MVPSGRDAPNGERIADLAADLSPFASVPDRIRQVFLNITLNAIDAMPDGGKLLVSTRWTAETLGIAISFADTGPGIDVDMLSRLFEPIPSAKPEGMGLRLYLARGIVESQGGHIDVDNRDAGGATFHLWLPA